MGLDMYLYKKTYVKKWEHIEDDKQFHVTVTRGGNDFIAIDPERVCYIVEEVGYWRKFNALHNWFVQNCQDGNDNCGEYYVEHEQLKELVEVLRKVIKYKDSVDAEVLGDLLPTASGFFFGGTDYDEWYFSDVQDTIELVDKLLLEDGGDFYYHSSW
jgi:hypothetical protein